MEEEKKEETPEEAPSSPQENPEEEQPEEGKEEVEQPEPESDDHFKKELDVLEGKKPQRTELEKAVYAREQIDRRIVDLGGDSLKAGTANNNANYFSLIKKEKPEQEFVTKDDFAENYARSLAKSENELKVIMWQYRHGIQKTGNIHEDIDNAYWLANKGRIKKLHEEIERSGERPSLGGGTGQKVKKTIVPEMPTDMQVILKRRGFSFNPKTGRWEARHNAYRYDPQIKDWVSEKK